MGGQGGWAAEGVLNPPLEVFGLTMCLGQFQTHAFHVVPSMVLIVSVVNLQAQQNSL